MRSIWVQRSVFKLIAFSACLAACVLISCSESLEDATVSKLDASGVYLLYRGTYTKEGLAVRDFNICDPDATHVGLLFFDKYWTVAHVMSSKTENDFLLQDISEFLSDENHIKYVSLWEVPSFTTTERHQLFKVLDSLKKEKVKFDLTFSNLPDDKLYCSEFVYFALSKAKKGCFSFQQSRKKLTQVQSLFLKRDSLDYFPVDMFQKDQRFKKIYAKHLNSQ
ncbi:MAG TPA: hypothetical protein VGB50_12705 [Flavobacterium sp.]|jgi:hypothetical protein